MCVSHRLRRPSHAGKSQNRARAQGSAKPRKDRAPLRSARGSASMALRRAAPAGWRFLTTSGGRRPDTLINPRGVYTESRTPPDSQPLDNVTRSLNEELNALEHPREMPDLFCVSDLGTWSALKHARSGSWESSYRSGSLTSPGRRGIAGSYGERHSHKGGPRDVTNVGAMVIDLVCRLAWERPELRQLVNYLRLVQGITALSGRGEKKWDAEEVLSVTLMQRVTKQRKAALMVPALTPEDKGPWNEWDWIFGGG